MEKSDSDPEHFSMPNLLITSYLQRSCSKLISQIRIRVCIQGKKFLSQILSSFFAASSRFWSCNILFVMPDVNFRPIKREMDRVYWIHLHFSPIPSPTWFCFVVEAYLFSLIQQIGFRETKAHLIWLRKWMNMNNFEINLVL